LRAELPLAALRMAISAQRPGAGLILHSDRGVQGGFKRSSQHRLCSLMIATRQGPPPAFSIPASFSVGR
jgi:putative transposase